MNLTVLGMEVEGCGSWRTYEGGCGRRITLAIKMYIRRWAWWCTPLIPALREDGEFKAGLDSY
jgi:hypothetical protein